MEVMILGARIATPACALVRNDRRPRHRLNLQLFAEGGDGGAGAAAPSGEGQAAAPTETGEQIPAAGGKRARRKPDPFANVVFGKEDSDTSSAAAAAPSPQGEGKDAEPTFEELIKGKYKADYDKAVQGIIQNRFKNQKAAENTLESLSPALALLAENYQVPAKEDGSVDYEALIKAIKEDDALFERQAAERGMSVDTYKLVHQLEQESEQRRRQEAVEFEERQRRDAFETLVQQAEEAKKIYPSFDLRAEINNPAFVRLTSVGVDAKTAFEVVHKDEILGASMQYAAQTAAKKVADAVASGSRRPTENGIGKQAPAPVRLTDPRKMTREQRAEMKRRVYNGAEIVL